MTLRDSTQLGRLRTQLTSATAVNAGYQVRVSSEIEDPDWDAFLSATPGGKHIQTSLWARVKASCGWRMTRIIVTHENRIVAGAQLLRHPLPLVGAIGYVPHGPLIAPDDPILAGHMIDELRRVAKAERILYLVVQPPSGHEALVGQLSSAGFHPSPIEIMPTATTIIDLTNDLDVIMARMKKKTRQHIRHGLREGIVVREGTEKDLRTFYYLLEATGWRQQFTPYSQQYLAEMWRVLRPKGYIKLFLAEYEGEAVSGQLAIPFGDTVVLKTSGWSGGHAHRRPNEVLHWAVMVWAKSQSYHYCDLEGIDPTAAQALLCGQPLPESAIQTATSFKLGFGGQVTLIPNTYDYVYNPILRRIYASFFPQIVNWPVVDKMREHLRTH